MEIHVIDYLTEKERIDKWNKRAIDDLKLRSKSYQICESPDDIGRFLDQLPGTTNKVCIHILSHGNKLGIAKSTNKYFLQVIHYELLLLGISIVKRRVPHLYLNFLAVCHSATIGNFSKRPYSKLWAYSGETSSIAQSLLIYKEPSYNLAAIAHLLPEEDNYLQLEGNDND